MMRRLRDSGIKWIGEIPENWRIESIGRHFENRNEKVSDYDYAPLSVTKSGVVPQLDEVAKSNAHEDRKLVRRGDFVINSRSDRKQSCGLSAYDGSVSLINLVLVPHGEIDSSYSSYLFNNYGFAEEFYRWGTGIVADLWSTKWDLMRRINVPVPPHAEQKKIADFLDGKCAEIDELVQTEEKMIEELKAYKQSVITEAVTKGLDSAAPMKDSGIEWIGAIPQSWRTMPIKHCCKINLESLKDTEKDDLLINYIDISSADENGNINFVDEITFLNAPSRARRIIRKGDVIISTVRTYLKVIALIDEKYDGFICSTGFAVLTPLEKVEARFLYYNIYTDSFTSRVSYYSNGISYPAINSSVLATLHITLPSIDEQKQIADYLDEKCAKIDEMIAIRNEQIDQLKDYKKSLIYEYVTGKKEVV